jgi:hypothetical protein
MKIEVIPGNFVYGSSFMSFAFCSRTGDGNTVKQLTRFESCREYNTHFLAEQAIWRRKIDAPLDRIKFIVGGGGHKKGWIKSVKKEIYFTKKLINTIEKRAGWETTRIALVKHAPSENSKNEVFMVSGPAQWIRYPAMLSLYYLILRSVTRAQVYRKVEQRPIETIQDVVDYFDYLVKDYKEQREWHRKKNKEFHRESDMENYVPDVVNYLSVLIENFDKIFEETGVHKTWENNYGYTATDFGVNVGLYAFLRNKSKHPNNLVKEARERLGKIAK